MLAHRVLSRLSIAGRKLKPSRLNPYNPDNMNRTTHPLMKMKLRPLWTCALVALLCSCAATSVKNTWKAPDCPGPVGKIAVLTIDERGLLRQGFENRLVAQMTKAGAPAVVTFDQLSLARIKQDKNAAAERLRASGAEALLLLRLIDVSSSYREYRPGRERYAATTTGIETMGWYDYFSVGFMDMGTTYGSLKQRVNLETSLYDLKTEKRLWFGVTQTVLKENMDRVAEMDPLVAKIVAAMRKDGVIR
jgi:hypothetical protein